MIELTRLSKTGGPLTKQISLTASGALLSDGSACVMSRGQAFRVRLDGLGQFADLIKNLGPHEAVALGTIREDLPDQVRVTTQENLARMNGGAPTDTIARTGSHIAYTPGQPALALIDVDTKGMPSAVNASIKAAGGFWAALIAVLPELDTTGRIIRRSTSTGITRTDTGEALAGSNGLHVYLHVADGGDIERFLRTLHDRCWLAGFGWHMLGAGGQLLDRSLVDKMVYAPERLVFEGAPVLLPPLAQDHASRCPTVVDHPPLDTKQACPAFRIVETTRLQSLKSASAHALAPDRAKARDSFITHQAGRLAARAGISAPEAKRVVERQCDGILLPDVALPWDDDEFIGCTVGDVLTDPARFVGATLADPLEGPDHGRSKAKVMRRADGSPWINSFAHGRTVYELRFDARAATAAVAAAPPSESPDVFVRIASNADLDADQMETLRNRVAGIASVGKRALDAKFKAAKAEQHARDQKAAQDQRAADRLDPRPQIPAPKPDSPWLPQMDALNDVLGSSKAAEPPMRDTEGVVTQVSVRRIPNMHALTAETANGETTEPQASAEQPLLTRLDEIQLAELIERHIDYIDDQGRSVHLATPFVKHFHTRADGALPTVAAIATLPIVLEDATLLSKRGLDRRRGIVFRVPPHLLAAIPKPADCTPNAVGEAMRFLIDEWLIDVATDYTGKCLAVAATLTIIERSLLNERPTYFVSAPRRGGGKTTLLNMIMTSVTGVRPSAAAWSPNEEERRKALLSYLLEGPPAIIWDNIPRGTQISCPHIEASCTAAEYSDRRLGVSQMVAVSAATIHLFTGNNIAPKGDFSSRSLQILLEIDRADPENRPFTHADPIKWTERHRPEILSAMYTVLLGNPALKSNKPGETRFKAWWRLVGAAVEHAAQCHTLHSDALVSAMLADKPKCQPKEISFRDLFLSQEKDDEESSSLADVLAALAVEHPNGDDFIAADIAVLLNTHNEQQSNEARERVATIREFLFPKIPQNQDVSAKSVGRVVKRHLGEPVKSGDSTLTLKERGRDPHSGPKGPLRYYVYADKAEHG